MTRNGKIARLPQVVQEQLNRRLDDHEPGKRLVAWLNSLPEVQAVIQAEFAGRPVREQNLSEWKKGGYADWQRRQERSGLFRQLQAEAGDLGAVMDEETFNRQLTVVLKADVALMAREVMTQTGDPCQRAKHLGILSGKFAQLRREESNAARTGVMRARWANELEKEKRRERAVTALFPLQALVLQRLFIAGLGRGDRLEQQATLELAADLMGADKSHPTESG